MSEEILRLVAAAEEQRKQRDILAEEALRQCVIVAENAKLVLNENVALKEKILELEGIINGFQR